MSGENLLSQDEVWDDTELIRMYEDSMSGRKEEVPEKQWKIGDTCMAPYEDLWYQAKITSINKSNKTVKVRFIEYEEDAVVPLDSLYSENEVTYEDEEEPEPEPYPSSSAHYSKVPSILPPPPQLFKTFENEKEVTNNMMLSWYMSGYHTGYFQAMRDFKKNLKR